MWTVLVHLKNFSSSWTETLDVWSGNSSSFPHPQACSYPYPSVMAAVDTSWRWHRRASVRSSGPGMSHLAFLQSSSRSQSVSIFPSLWISQIILQLVEIVYVRHDACWFVDGHLATGTKSCCEQNVPSFWICTSQWDCWPTLAILCFCV